MTKRKAFGDADKAIKELALLVFTYLLSDDKKAIEDKIRQIQRAVMEVEIALETVVAISIAESFSNRKPLRFTDAELQVAQEAATTLSELHHIYSFAKPLTLMKRQRLLKPVVGRYMIACKRLLPKA